MFVPISIGDLVKPIAVEKFRGSEGTREVVAVMSTKVNAAGIHFSPGMGYFYCFKGRCCQELGLAQLRYVIPLICYTVQETHPKTQVPTKWGSPMVAKYLALGKDAYESDLLVKHQLQGDITKFDLLVSCVDDQYQKLKFEVMGPCQWRTRKESIPEVQELAKEYRSLIGLSVARTLSEAQFDDFMSQPPRDPKPGSQNQRKSQPVRQSLPAARQVAAPPVDEFALEESPKAVVAAGEHPKGMGVDELLDGPANSAAPTVSNVASAAVPASELDFADLLDPSVPEVKK